MRPTSSRRLLSSRSLSAERTSGVSVALVTWAVCGACAACEKEAMQPRAPSSAARPTLEVTVADPVAAPAPSAVPVTAAATSNAPNGVEEAPADPGPDPLPRAWMATGPLVPGLSFADALRKARNARDAHDRLVVPAPTAREPELKLWFMQMQARADEASRMYAAAFHAPDATREGRIDAIAEAAELAMMTARGLDDANLAIVPTAWRADPALASTFEDIAVGPTRRWRDEARVLARQCIEDARASGVLTEAARRCAVVRTGAPVKVVTRGADGGAPCACSPGDPLCSASLGGWCGGATR